MDKNVVGTLSQNSLDKDSSTAPTVNINNTPLHLCHVFPLMRSTEKMTLNERPFPTITIRLVT